MYYAMIALAVVMFGGTFVLNRQYERQCGNDFFATILFTLCSGGVGLLALLIINRFTVGYTPFTLVMAALTALNSILFSFCSLRALHTIDLSLYSLFSMIGGMALPFVAGILRYGEPMTLAKGLCFAVITVALIISRRTGERKGGAVYYIAVFVLNGMSGVLAKIFAAEPYAKANAADYSILAAAMTVAAALVLLPVAWRYRNGRRLTAVTVGVAAGHGILNRVANLLLLIALGSVPASVQYPMVTGGVMIVSTAIGFLSKNKPTKREVAAVVLAFVGIILLVIIPI